MHSSMTSERKGLLHSTIFEEKIYAFKHDIKTKNIGEIHIYHVDPSILTEENGKRKCMRHTTIKNSSYLRYLYLVIIRNYLVVIIFTRRFCFITMISIY